MIRDPLAPEPVTAAKQEEAGRLHARVSAAEALADKSGMTFSEALIMLEAAPDTAEQLAGLGSMTLSELCEDQDRYGDVVCALMAERRATRDETETWLLDRHMQATERRGRGDVVPGEGLQLPDEVTLSACLEGTGVSVGRVMTLAADHEQARTLAAPPKGMVKREVDDWGEVLRPLGEDVDALLADPLAVRRDYRRARELELVADDGGVELDDENEDFKRFKQTWRSYVNRGLDLLATLELRDGERKAELERQRQVGEIERKVQSERLDAARKQRALAADLVEQARRLEAA